MDYVNLLLSLENESRELFKRYNLDIENKETYSELNIPKSLSTVKNSDLDKDIESDSSIVFLYNEEKEHINKIFVNKKSEINLIFIGHGNIKNIVTNSDDLKLNIIVIGSFKLKNLIVGNVNSNTNAKELIICRSSNIDITDYILNYEEGSKINFETLSIISKGKVFSKGYAKITNKAINSFSNLEIRGIILDKESQFVPLPHMNIENANVLGAQHGASILFLDEEMRKYLESRGLNKKSIDQLYITSAIDNSISTIKNDELKKFIDTLKDRIILNVNIE